MKLSALSACIAAILVWTHAHPALVAVAVMFAVSSLHDNLAKYPRLQAVSKIAAGLGFDFPKVTAGILQVLTGEPSVPASAVVKLLPPAALLLLLSACLCACGGSQMDAALSAYSAQNAACVTLSTSLAQEKECVAKTQDVWCGDGGLWQGSDAGLCAVQVSVSEKDAGHE